MLDKRDIQAKGLATLKRDTVIIVRSSGVRVPPPLPNRFSSGHSDKKKTLSRVETALLRLFHLRIKRPSPADCGTIRGCFGPFAMEQLHP